MKTWRIILLTAGILLLLLPALSLTVSTGPEQQDAAYRTGYYMGQVMVFLPGVLCLLRWRTLGKRMRRREAAQLLHQLPGRRPEGTRTPTNNPE
ncbi:MAG TPA: hypothetical protein VHK69_07345 [Chitinophagaceae bacterium]|jgi:uncharacterized protein YhhL (DUF1145 family)|nr:hypothetical protein [Chitinophagaceae bacterium]